MEVDFDTFFRNKIECLLIKSSWVGKVQQLLALEAVSQVWSDRPEWYFWIRGAPGAYSLALADAEMTSAGGRQLFLGHFTLKCFPYPKSRAWAGFSKAEQGAVKSDLFDSTNTPRAEDRCRMPDHWFSLGAISILVDQGPAVAQFTYDSLEQMRLIHPPQDGGSADDSQIIRNLGAWRLGYPMIDCLIGLYSFYSQTAPGFVGASRSPGFEYLFYAGQKPRCRSTADTSHLTLSALFAEPERLPGWINALWTQQLDCQEQVIFSSTFSEDVTRTIKVPKAPAARVNPLWWELAHSDYKSEKASTCGCADHDHPLCAPNNLLSTMRS